MGRAAYLSEGKPTKSIPLWLRLVVLERLSTLVETEGTRYVHTT